MKGKEAGVEFNPDWDIVVPYGKTVLAIARLITDVGIRDKVIKAVCKLSVCVDRGILNKAIIEV